MARNRRAGQGEGCRFRTATVAVFEGRDGTCRVVLGLLVFTADGAEILDGLGFAPVFDSYRAGLVLRPSAERAGEPAILAGTPPPAEWAGLRVDDSVAGLPPCVNPAIGVRPHSQTFPASMIVSRRLRRTALRGRRSARQSPRGAWPAEAGPGVRPLGRRCPRGQGRSHPLAQRLVSPRSSDSSRLPVKPACLPCGPRLPQ